MSNIKGRNRVTVYIDGDLTKAFDLYKAQHDDTTISLSGLLNIAMRQFLDDPFKWNNSEMYYFAFPKDTDEWEVTEYED